MSGSAIRTRPHRFHSPRRARSLGVALSVALGSAALVTAGALAADPDAPGPGSPQWTRHLDLEYDTGTSGHPIGIGPGSPEWARHLELEYGSGPTGGPTRIVPGSPEWTRHLELEYGG